MMNIESREKLLARYRSLRPIEQNILQILSLAYEKLVLSEIGKLVRALKICSPEKNRTLRLEELKLILHKLEKRGLVVKKQGRFLCHPMIAEPIARERANAPDFPQIVSTIHQIFPADNFFMYGWHWRDRGRFLRDIRLAILQKEDSAFQKALEVFWERAFGDMSTLKELYYQIFHNPFDADWFTTLPLIIQAEIISTVMPQGIWYGESLSPYLHILELHQDCSDPELGSLFRELLSKIWILQGRFEEVEALIQKDAEKVYSTLYLAWMTVLKGEYDAALPLYEEALRQLQKESGKRKIFFQHFSGLYYLLLLLRDPQQNVKKYIPTGLRDAPYLEHCFRALEGGIYAQQGQAALAKNYLQNIPSNTFYTPFAFIFHGLIQYWFFPKYLRKYRRQFEEAFEQAVNNGYRYYALEIAHLLRAIVPDESRYREYIEQTEHETPLRSVSRLLSQEEEWKRSLRALTHLGQRHKSGAEASGSRLVWMLQYQGPTKFHLIPRIQKRTRKGGWTSGRMIDIARLIHQKPDYLTPQDRRVINALQTSRTGHVGYNYYQPYNFEQALLELVGHPLIFLEDAYRTRIQLVKGEPELIVEEKQTGFSIRFSVAFEEANTVQLIKESPTRFKVIEIKPEHHKIADIFGGETIHIPAEGKEQLLEAIHSLAPVITVHSAIEGTGGDISTEEADTTPVVHLLPMGKGFKLELLIRPFGKEGPYFKPGTGGKNIISEINGKHLQVHRDLLKERNLAQEIIQACPSLIATDEGTYEWIFRDAEECLQVLLELEAVKDRICLEWPEGEKLKIAHRVSPEQLSIRIQRRQDWFALSGKLQLDESRVMDLKQLLEMVEASPGKFVQIGEGEYLALTEKFRKRLEELRAYSEKSRSGVKIHPLAAFALEEFIEEAKTAQVDAQWKAQLERLRNAQEYTPQLPSTFQGTLRDYQLEGFNWLSRLAYWGVGGCLADDMGLGKTVQTLALLLQRAPDGPALVVCPASVTFNWAQEAKRFTPTLNPILVRGKEEVGTLSTVGAFDLVICSYNMVQRHAETLAEIPWNTIVLDEAQAIKNAATKRSKAVMNLQGNFKMITTGTPIENHLGELWNLFRFINPGLLGSWQQFSAKFAVPIEKYEDVQAKKRLKKLIRPFILRRLKSDVLEELPPKTEITLTVELTPEEAAFYEALRKRALEKLSQRDEPAGEHHLRILAELMRLRRACCHPRLVLGNGPLENSKLSVFREIVEELRENRHKALVFSQFVDYLKIVEEFVQQMGISYQYLDGSTPIKERQKRVEAFQRGEGDLFLISLKAGGMGLNLTAADYVIHLDPWWNPAVEDQASDRAHRIGQTRPVTVYRLVTRGTVEEKIVALHVQKRDLADSLLEGTDISGKISAEELLELLKE